MLSEAEKATRTAAIANARLVEENMRLRAVLVALRNGIERGLPRKELTQHADKALSQK